MDNEREAQAVDFADETALREALGRRIVSAIKPLASTQVEAARLLGIPQSHVSLLMGGRARALSTGRLLSCLQRLGHRLTLQEATAASRLPPPRTAAACDEELIERIYEGPFEERPWQSLVKAVRRRTGCDVAAMSLRIAAPGDPVVNVYDMAASFQGADPDAIPDSASAVGHLNPLATALRNSRDVFTLDDVIPREELVQSDVYRLAMHPFGTEYAVGMCIAERGGWKCHIGMINGPGKRNFDDGDKQFLLSMSAHLERALAIYAQNARNEVERDTYAHALDLLAIGAIVMDEEGKVVDANGAALDLVGQSSCLSLVGNTLRFRTRKDAVAFEQMVAGATERRRHGDSDAYVDALRIEAADGSCLDLLIRIVSPSLWYHAANAPRFVLYLSTPDRQPELQRKFVARIFGLSASEAWLATLLASGISLHQAAATMEISPATARTYLSRIFAKTGVSKQSDLMRMILKSVAVLTGH